MKPVIILLCGVTIVLGVVCIQQRRIARGELVAAEQQTQVVSNALEAAGADLATLKTRHDVLVGQLQQLQQQVATLAEAKAVAEAQRQQAQQQTEALGQELAAARKTAQNQAARLTALETEKEKLVAEAADIAEQLRSAKQQLAAQGVTPAVEPRAIGDEQAGLELASLKARWNDLAALKAQLCAVSKRVRQERIAAWKRRDAEAAATGNRGILYRAGQQ